MSVASKIKSVPTPSSKEPVWKGPEVDGVTSSLLNRFLNDPERFRLLTIEGLKPVDRFNKYLEYGNMWHICEEAVASEVSHFGEHVGTTLAEDNLLEYATKLLNQYPFDRDEVAKWFNVCKIQFPAYVKYWAAHPDMIARTSILSEKVFTIDYVLPNGRVVKLRGKWDSVDLVEHGDADIKSGIWNQENKTISAIDAPELRKRFKFDMQTMIYFTALSQDTGIERLEMLKEDWPLIGTRQNYIRRPLGSGQKGCITKHQAKQKKAVISKRTGQTLHSAEYTPAETDEQFYNRLKTEYIDKEPESYFARWNCEVSPQDVKRFRERFLDPILTRLCMWYDWVAQCKREGSSPFKLATDPHDYDPGLHWQHPYGVRNILDEGGSTDLDGYLETGSEAGLTRTTNLFPELT